MTEQGKPKAGSLATGAAWMIAMRWAMRLVGLASTLVIARLLSPDDFGVVAVALIVAGLLETIAYLGVDLSLIKDQGAEREDFDSAWTVQLAQGVMIAMLLLLTAPFVASYFNEPRATAVIAWLAVRPIIDGLQNIGLVLFRKELDFAREFRFNLIAKLLGAAIQIGAAWWLRNYWALVTGMLASAAVSTLLSYLLHPYRPRLTLVQAKKVWAFSQWLLVSRVGSFLGRRCDEFIVGRAAGTAAMGAYHVVYELATMPTTEIIMPMRRALFPALSTLADQPQAYRRAVLDSLAASATVCVGLGVGLASLAEWVIPVLLGPQWTGAVVLLRWLALFGMLAALTSVLEVPLWVAGRTNYSAMVCWLELAVAVPLLLWIVPRHGAEGAAMCRVVISLGTFPVAAWLVRSACGVSLRSIITVLGRPVLAGVAMGLAVRLLPVQPQWPILATLAAGAVVATSAYCAVLWATWVMAGRPQGFEAAVLRAAASLLSRVR